MAGETAGRTATSLTEAMRQRAEAAGGSGGFSYKSKAQTGMADIIEDKAAEDGGDADFVYVARSKFLKMKNQRSVFMYTTIGLGATLVIVLGFMVFKKKKKAA